MSEKQKEKQPQKDPPPLDFDPEKISIFHLESETKFEGKSILRKSTLDVDNCLWSFEDNLNSKYELRKMDNVFEVRYGSSGDEFSSRFFIFICGKEGCYHEMGKHGKKEYTIISQKPFKSETGEKCLHMDTMLAQTGYWCFLSIQGYPNYGFVLNNRAMVRGCKFDLLPVSKNLAFEICLEDRTQEKKFGKRDILLYDSFENCFCKVNPINSGNMVLEKHKGKYLVDKNGITLMLSSKSIDGNGTRENISDFSELRKYYNKKYEKRKITEEEEQQGFWSLDSFPYGYVAKDGRNDKLLILEAVRENGLLLKYANRFLRKDREVVLEAVKNDGRALLFAESVDQEIVEVAVRNFGFMLSILRYRRHYWRIKETKDMILNAVRQFGSALRFASHDWKGNEDVVLEAVKNQAYSLTFAKKELRTSPVFIQKVLKVNGFAMEFVGDQMKDNKEFLLKVISENRNVHTGLALRFVSERVKNDADVVLETLTYCRDAIQYVGDILMKRTPILSELKEEGDVERFYEKKFWRKKRVPWTEWEKKLMMRMICVSPENASIPVQLKPWLMIDKEKRTLAIAIENEENEVLEKLLLKVSSDGNEWEKDFEILRPLGMGAYGSTYLVRLTCDKSKLCVAKFYKSIMGEAKVKEQVLRDSLVLPFHENVVSILSHRVDVDIDFRKFPDYESFWSGFGVDLAVSGFVVMKYHRTSLENYIDARVRRYQVRDFKILEIAYILEGVLKGANHLHQHMIVHRDIHSGNIFIDDIEGRIWIGDFGCALNLRNNKFGFKVEKNDELMFSLTSLGDEKTFRLGGCIGFQPPEVKEVITQTNLSSDKVVELIDYEKYDLYSIGVLGKALLGSVRKSERTTNAVVDLVENLLKSASERIGFNNALRIIEEIVNIMEVV